MGLPVVAGATTQCSFGLAPGVLNVVPTNRVMFENRPVANILDNKPFLNVTPFGMCSSLANPITAALTAAALGVLTPGACTPVPVTPWVPGAVTTLIGTAPALTTDSQCVCAYGGVVKVVVGGAFTEQVN